MSSKSVQILDIIRKFALLNAIEHNGKAEIGSVMGKVLREKPELKNKIKDLMVNVTNTVKEVNSLALNSQLKIVKEKWSETTVKEKIKEKKSLPPLPNVLIYSKVITRFSPNPDCVLHLGSARALVLSYEYAKMYDGIFILRFEDTDPKTKTPALKFYEYIRDDLDWLDCKPSEEYIQSDRLPIYYKYAEELLRKNYSYICTCETELFRRKILDNKSCNCRTLSSEENLDRWQNMLKGGFGEGEAVYRIKTDLNHPNPAVRDWPALRIINSNRHPHPRVGNKYVVWPLYNFACGVDDHLMGVTHIIRGKEHFTNMIRQKYLYNYLGWVYPEAIHYGRLKIKDTLLSKSKIVEGVSNGTFKDWTDPRLATLVALRRRGITPASIRILMRDIGPKSSDIEISWKNLYAYNRKNLDRIANRYFFVDDPVKLKVKNIPKVFNTKIPLHPSLPEKGSRQYQIKPVGDDKSAFFWIAKKDVNHLKIGSTFRLIELFNIQVEILNQNVIEASFIGESLEKIRKSSNMLIQWILEGEGVACKIVMPDTSEIKGFAESFCRQLRPSEIVQFKRFGFVRFDSVGKDIVAYFAHK